jgi:hypothetical protein
MQTKDIQNITICKLIINKHEKIGVAVYWNNVGVPG